MARKRNRFEENEPGQQKLGFGSTDWDGSDADEKARQERDGKGPGLFSTNPSQGWEPDQSDGLFDDGFLASTRSKDQSKQFEEQSDLAEAKKEQAARDRELAAGRQDRNSRLVTTKDDDGGLHYGYRNKPDPNRKPRQKEVYTLGNGWYVKTKRKQILASRLQRAEDDNMLMSVRVKFRRKIGQKGSDDIWAEDGEKSARVFGNGISAAEFNRRLYEPDESRGDQHLPGDLGQFLSGLTGQGKGFHSAEVEQVTVHAWRR